MTDPAARPSGMPECAGRARRLLLVWDVHSRISELACLCASEGSVSAWPWRLRGELGDSERVRVYTRRGCTARARTPGERTRARWRSKTARARYLFNQGLRRARRALSQKAPPRRSTAPPRRGLRRCGIVLWSLAWAMAVELSRGSGHTQRSVKRQRPGQGRSSRASWRAGDHFTPASWRPPRAPHPPRPARSTHARYGRTGSRAAGPTCAWREAQCPHPLESQCPRPCTGST